MKLYIDIDGVLLTNKKSIPEYIDVFVNFILMRYDCYWLTTHCRGNENRSLEYLSEYLPEEIIDRLTKVKATDWMDLKTEAIDFNSDFIWLEDYPFEAEKNILLEKAKSENLIQINLANKQELLFVIEKMIQLERKWAIN